MLHKGMLPRHASGQELVPHGVVSLYHACLLHWSLLGSQRAGIGAEVRGILSFPAAGQKRCSSCFAKITRILSTGRLCFFPRYGGASRRLHYRRGGPDEMTAPAVPTMRRTTIARLTSSNQSPLRLSAPHYHEPAIAGDSHSETRSRPIISGAERRLLKWSSTSESHVL
jgi:hypothetical protein